MRMKCWYYIIILFFQFSCREELKEVMTTDNDIAVQIKNIQSIQPSSNNRDSLFQEIHRLLQQEPVKNNDLYKAKVNYQLARIYGMSHQNDSAAVYLQTAFDLIEQQPGNLDEKARIYQGIGNISWSEGQLHKANYYYNKAAAIILADNEVTLPDAAKVSILLAAGQSNLQFQRYDLASEMNKMALALSSSLPEGHTNRQRPITQLIKTYYHSNQQIDSIAYYIGEMEKMNHTFPNDYNPYFLNESKTLYYTLIQQTDSVLKYHKLNVSLLERTVPHLEKNNVSLSNLFVSYTNVAGLLTQNDQLSEAALYFDKTAKLLKDYADKIDDDDLILYHKNAELYYQKKGDMRQALIASDAIIKIQQSFYNRQNTQAVAEMNSLYEIQAQERSIKQLNENVKIKELHLQRNQLWLTVSLLGALIMLLIIVFLYYGFRQRRIRQEKDKIILQQKLLRTQMEPHFIFNTLTALQSYIRRGESDKAISYLGKFSKLLRSSLELSREESVSLEDEIATLERYLSLQQLRFEYAFKFEITVDDKIDAAVIYIPPMLIQPFVENAILHGVDMKSEYAFVRITISLANELLKIDITDSGRLQKKKISEGHRSLSGVISRERVALLGKKARMETKINDGGGTSVTIFLPVKLI